MKEFKRFLEEEKVQQRTPRPDQAQSLIQKSQKRLKYVEERTIRDDNADLVLEDAYDSIREALDAFLIKNGYKSYSHEATIVYAFEELELSYETVNKLNKFRKLRNDSKYRGEDITTNEAKEVLRTAKNLIPELKDRFQNDSQ